MFIIKEANPKVEGSEPVAIKYGLFVMTLIEFLIVGAAIFMLVKVAKKFEKKKEAEAPAGPPAQEVLLTEIRDLLRK